MILKKFFMTAITFSIVFILAGCHTLKSNNDLSHTSADDTGETILVGTLFPDKTPNQIIYFVGDGERPIADTAIVEKYWEEFIQMEAQEETLSVPIEGFIRIDFVYEDEAISFSVTSDSFTLDGQRYSVNADVMSRWIDGLRNNATTLY